VNTRPATVLVPIVVKLAVIVSLIVFANFATLWFIDRLNIQIWPEYMEIVDRTVLICIVLYVVLMAIPFLPGIEIGLILMSMLGPKGVLVTYLCTIAALAIGFGLGRLLPTRPLIMFLRWLKLARAEALLMAFDATPPKRRLAFLAEKAPAGAAPALLRHRYLLVAFLLNIPGNALIGGGGGIAMMAGLSRLYSFPQYLFTIAVATLPGPIVFLVAKSFP